MHHRLLLLGLSLLLLTSLTSCRHLPATGATTVPLDHVAYVLSGENAAFEFPKNRLTIVDTTTWEIYHTVKLPRSWAFTLSQDPQGRIWIGFSGGIGRSDDLVQVYSPAGELLRELHPCDSPEAGISFAAGRAFIACATDGFTGQVVVMDLDDLTVEKIITLELGEKNFLAVSSAASTTAVVVTGLTTGPGVDAYHTAVMVLDPTTLDITTKQELGAFTLIERILPAGDTFYFINASGSTHADSPPHLMQFTPGDPGTITPIPHTGAPLRGVINEPFLYTYNTDQPLQPGVLRTGETAHNHLTRLDLTSGDQTTWPLPLGWTASDLTVIDGQIILVDWDAPGDKTDGLYHFDPASGSLTLLVNIPDASTILYPGPS